MIFWIATLALLLVALLILIVPLMRGAQSSEDDQRRRQNVQIAREQKRQLDAQLQAGELDQAGYDGAYAELQKMLALELEHAEGQRAQARGKWMASVVLVAIPVASLSLYFLFGEYRVIENPLLAQANPHQGQTRAEAPQMTLDEMHESIKARLQQNPEDVEGWFMLGRTLMAKQQYEEAVVAYRRSDELMPNEPGILFALADAMAMNSNGNLLGEPEALIKRGLEAAPMYPNGLWLAGMAAEQRGDYSAAHRYWTRLLPLIADNASSSHEVAALIARLEEQDPSLAQAGAGSDAAVAAALSVAVDISPELKSRARPDDTVFVYAKAMQGPPMPLAVKRLQLKDLPVELTLSDADAMMPAMKLSSFDQVVVGARVSPSGNPVAQSGDFFTERGGIDRANPPAQISLTIDQVK